LAEVPACGSSPLTGKGEPWLNANAGSYDPAPGATLGGRCNRMQPDLTSVSGKQESDLSVVPRGFFDV